MIQLIEKLFNQTHYDTKIWNHFRVSIESLVNSIINYEIFQTLIR